MVWWEKTRGEKIIRESEFRDIQFAHEGRSYCVEAKFASGSKRRKISHAIGQLLDYNLFPGNTSSTYWIVLVNSKPRPKERKWVEQLRDKYGENQFPVFLGWQEGEDFKFDGLDL